MKLPVKINQWPAAYLELWNERAAIIEYLGNRPRLEAEFIAEDAIRRMAQEENRAPISGDGL